jgi:hypothetical protein
MTNALVWRVIIVLTISAIVALSPCAVLLAQSSDSPADVRIVVHLIEASNGVPGVDSQIKDIIKDVKGELRYSTYKLISRVPKKIKVGDRENISLPDSRELLVFANGYENGRVKLRVKIVEKSGGGSSRDVLNTEFRLVEGGTIIIGAYNYREGKLILAISADK